VPKSAEIGQVYLDGRAGRLLLAVGPDDLVSLRGEEVVRESLRQEHAIQRDMPVEMLCVAWGCELDRLDDLSEDVMPRPVPRRRKGLWSRPRQR